MDVFCHLYTSAFGVFWRMSTAISTHTGAGPLSLMSCVRESSPPQDAETDYENEKNVGGQKKKRFWNKWFGKRKNKVSDDVPSPSEVVESPKESQRSRSTSELSENEEPTKRRNGTPMHPGLSVSHDSVFHSPHSGSEIELEGAQSSSSLSIHHHHTDRLQTELTERLRLRRGRGDTSEDDEGLPRSPCNSPTATDKTAVKDNPKSHSTCSEGSLLSVGSSEMDEDSFGQHSIHSSKLSLEDKSTPEGDFDLDLSVKNTSAPLNHSGARHKASVKPKRRHGAPRKKRLSGSVLPTTPEVNEESAVRSLTPDVNSTKEIVTELYSSASSNTTNSSNMIITSSSSSSSSKSMIKSHRTALSEKQLKCSSLPPGLAAPGSDSNKLNRSRSNAGAKYQEEFAALGEEEEASKDSKKADSFLGRIFPRRSGKKKKSKDERVISTSSTTLSSSTSVVTNTISSSSKQETVESSVKEFIQSERKLENVAVKPIPVPRSGAAARQRIQPNDIPPSPELGTHFDDILAKSSPDRPHLPPASPLQIELENHFQQRLASLSTSPKSPLIKTPPISPKLQRSPLVSPPKSPLLYPKVPPKSHVIEKVTSRHTKSEESRSKVVITGLSPFQQRINANNLEDEDCGFRSLSDLPTEAIRPSKLVAKSHSFKLANNNNNEYEKPSVENRTTFAALASTRSTHEIQTTSSSSKTILSESKEFRREIKKTNSLDSMKTFDAIDAKTETIEENVKVEQSKVKEVEHAVDKTATPDCEEKLERPPSRIESDSDDTQINLEAKNIFNKACVDEAIVTGATNKIVQSESKEFNPTPDFLNSGITISGPRHKAIVSVTNQESTSMTSSEMSTKSEVSEVKQVETSREIKEQQISVTKIQVKQESTQFTTVTKGTVPEFMNIQLHKVEKPLNNVVLTAGIQSPKDEEQNKTMANDLPDLVTCNSPAVTDLKAQEVDTPTEIESVQISESIRKFSKEDIEIVEKGEDEDEKKHVATALVTITTMTPPVPTRIFKKSDFQIRKSLVTVSNSEKPILKTKSSSLDIVESIKNNDEETDFKAKTQSVNDLTESAEPTVPLRRKSMANKQRQEDEPELMKVFARRSLKLKDTESESLSQQVIKMMEESNVCDVKSRDSDKENQLDSPSEERKKIVQKELPKVKEPLLETKFVEVPAEVTLRKVSNATSNNNHNNKLYSYQRIVSLNNAKTNDFNNYERMQKQNTCADRPKTDHWINYKGTETDPCVKICQDDILATMAEKTLIEEEFCTKPKNFNQRKAEWEKRAQEASRKTTP